MKRKKSRPSKQELKTYNKLRNYGLKINPITPDNHIFGSGAVPFEIIRPDGDWTNSLVQKEFQNLNQIEPYACVAFTILNCVEILIKEKYGEERNYSDRFLAAVSGTKEGGNDPHIVCEFLRKVGVVLQEIWPFDETITTFEKFYEPLPPKLYELAQEFKPDEIKIGKLNVDEAPSAPSLYQVMSIPTLMIFKGGKPVSKLVGIQNKSALKTMINELIKQ